MTWEDLQKERTEDLLDFIRYKSQPDYKELAEASFIAFTYRFNKEVIDKCRKICKNWGYDKEVADLIAERAFDRLWKYPLGFSKENCKYQELDTCVKLYLFRIARNCFYDYLKEESGEHLSPYDGHEEIIVEFPSLENLEIPDDKLDDLHSIYGTIEKALSTLSQKHKIIYLTYKAYEKEGYKLPRHLLQKLRSELELSQNSIRVYKNEANKIVDEHLKIL